MARTKVSTRTKRGIQKPMARRKRNPTKAVEYKVIPVITNVVEQLEKSLQKQEKSHQSSVKRIDRMLTKAKSRKEKTATRLEQLEQRNARASILVKNLRELKQLQKVRNILEQECQTLEKKLSIAFDALSSCQFELEILLRLKKAVDNLKVGNLKARASFKEIEYSDLIQPGLESAAVEEHGDNMEKPATIAD